MTNGKGLKHWTPFRGLGRPGVIGVKSLPPPNLNSTLVRRSTKGFVTGRSLHHRAPLTLEGARKI